MTENSNYLLLIQKFFEKTKEGLNRTTFDVKIDGELKDGFMSWHGQFYPLDGTLIQTANAIITDNELFKKKYNYQISLKRKYKCESSKFLNSWTFLVERSDFILFKNGKCIYNHVFTDRQRNHIDCFDYTFDSNNYYLIPDNEKEIIKQLISKERDLLYETEEYYNNSDNFTSFHYYADPAYRKMNDRLIALNNKNF
jgi:hypothetical protein